jgi:signal transduction histidine kinase
VDLVNAHAEEMLGTEARPGGWVGADSAAVVDALAARMADPAAFRDGERQMRRDGDATGFRLDAADGGHFEGLFVPLAEHGYPGHAWLLWDVTSREERRRRKERRMRAEIAAHRLGVHAQQQRAREAEIAGQQLQERNEALSAVDALRKQLLATASHELRSPLASITSFCELLTDSVDPEGEGGEFIRIIERNATKLLHLVDDLLTLAMLGVPGHEPQTARTDLAALVNDAAAHALAQARHAEIALNAHIAGHAWAQVDAVRIGQVLDNLVGNAVKYSRAGDRVDVRLEPEGEPGFHRVRVADTGIGIPAEELSKVFDEFYRASTARTSGVPGTGLGLVIAQTIARKHGGNITLSSGAGQGTTAVLRLPATA